MDTKDVSSDQVIAEMLEMGFEYANVVEALKAAGPSIHSALEFILNNAGRNCGRTSLASINNSKFYARNEKGFRKRDSTSASSHSLSYVRQSSILDHLQSANESTKSKTDIVLGVPSSGLEVPPDNVEELKEPFSDMDVDSNILSGNCKADSLDELESSSDWEQKASNLLQKHFGFSCLKSFQKEALTAWVTHKDCLVLAATGSGKSLCFQIPALLSGKVVVVISPLISLMHDQCLKLSRHGISACFLGSGQPDNTVEHKAMRGMYSIIYVCPETVLRLIKPLQKLAKSHGIALFAIDEVHCVSKWGHDFRPDYRRLSALRENFGTSKLEFLEFDIPLMALTATATNLVREDVLKSLHMSKKTKIVLTSFFRPNLRFIVRHSKTFSTSYGTDFHELVELYGKKQKSDDKEKAFILKESPDVFINSDAGRISEVDCLSPCDLDGDQDDYSEGDISVLHSRCTNGAINGRELSVEYLENDIEVFQSVDDWDVACGEFCGQPPQNEWELSEIVDPPKKSEGRLRLIKEPLEQGPTIIYVPTRKETLKIAKYLCEFGVKAAAYNASLPKSHLRRVHKDFHENTLEVVVATVAFGMGIDKLNVRRIIHYGWPQSLEAYYQEAGRAGRDGKLADCILYANLSREPSLLPSHRSEEQLKHAYVMLSDCFRYGMNTSSCRAETLVKYFGEDFHNQKCLICDVCVDGPPQMQNLREEACTLLQAVAEHCGQSSDVDGICDDNVHSDPKKRRIEGRLSLNLVVRKIREQSQNFLVTDMFWWRGLARVMERQGYIREGDEKSHVQIRYPEPTELGLKFVSDGEQAFYAYPEADMLLAAKSSNSKPYSSFSDWGKGWADPEIRRQRLQRMQLDGKPAVLPGPRKSRKRNAVRVKPDLRTCRGRLAAKLSRHT
ncbi:ATP-dependent DNA helicase Q-like SIM [Prosopis cineraria]|uniref:ATP-dependent DNA helicase Q-like SIM n=1 Tax=Prosopis cineraria TaxID=364024 RepID=UPI00240EC952|nr:ATP-dependent DNA helicase Q-like SIM [Prosopis cineraria]XP_054801927.1 ATP-dependent DNA helicase Q-like SIM [Prosopis cineraria]XP_054801928.1 ATP-dependent DNA helicase Q-like SIM [Prosopis cineraria]XP_054801929.1 ATP-dependent DNA helicase Q-like SIM [Prosopis cineraria]